MGACDFENYGIGSDVIKTFEDLVNKSLYEYGHDIYITEL